MKRALLALPLLLVLAACGSDTKTQTVTWTPQPAPAPVKAAAACKAAQLRLDEQNATETKVGGTVVTRVALRNTGAPCALAAGLTVRLEPALVLQTAPIPPPGTAAATALLGSLGSNREAGLAIQWTNWCVKGKQPKTLRIVLPAKGGSLTLAAPAQLPKCYEISAPTTIATVVSPVLASAPAAASESLEARILAPGDDPDEPLSAKPGGTLRYQVELTNTSDDDLPATPCPLFAQQLAGGVPDVHVLACAGLDAGASQVFEMLLPISAVTVPGAHTLRWVLDPYASQRPSATAPVTITAG